MKTIATALLVIIIPVILSAQAKEFNSFLQQYALKPSIWEKQLPIALQNSKELAAPCFFSPDTLLIVKWEDIDSVRIFDFYEGSVSVVVFGRVLKYKRCQIKDSCNAIYLDSVQISKRRTDSLLIPLILKTHEKSPAFSNKIRKRFIKLIKRLKNIPVVEIYRPVIRKHSYNGIMQALVLCPECDDYKEPLYFSVKYLQRAKKITFRRLVPDSLSVVSSFKLDVFQDGKISSVVNEGSNFSDELLQLLRVVKTGSIISFEYVKIKLPNGSIRKITMPGFVVK